MRQRMSADEWKRIFPTWPPPTPGGVMIGTVANTRYAGVISAVLLDEPWPGIVAPDEDVEETIVFRVGRWCVTPTALICLGSDYEIGDDRLHQTDWFAHLREKTWFYDPSDFLDALAAARKQFLPLEQEDQREAAINEQIQIAIQRHRFPFYPSRVAGHVYLVSHMYEEERTAFSAFLVDQGYFGETD